MFEFTVKVRMMHCMYVCVHPYARTREREERALGLQFWLVRVVDWWRFLWASWCGLTLITGWVGVDIRTP